MRRLLLTLALAAFATGAAAQVQSNRFNNNYTEPEPWKELETVAPPAYPADEGLIEFYVSAVATNRYFIDEASLAPGSDGVVRYVLVVKTSGGATNVSFEGIHCEARSWKHYASGRPDKTWSVSRAARQEWRPIENKPVNPHHAALARYFFCPRGVAIYSVDVGRKALRAGKHPDAD